ncbi:hypothetical protein [Planobispora takensis]|uniref:hypothetical protein n=1 Tax=Planobispora takensis TaxID=1367882 RepID=UPI0019435253|nr:hypothetical protein [Planobispora takensis]
MRRARTAVALVSLAALAACGQAPKAEVASAGGPAASASPSASSQADGVKFAQCMREHGVDMPDPEPGGGPVRIQAKGDRNTLEKAHKACQKYAPTKLGKSLKDDPGAQKAMLQFVRCMRENGVDMPDPDFSGGGVRIGGPGLNPDSPQFKKAQAACEKYLPGMTGKRP